MNLTSTLLLFKKFNLFFVFGCLAIPVEGFAQDNLNFIEFYQSKGEVPVFISTHTKSLYIQESIYPHAKKGKIKKGDRASVLSEILNSGMVVYGDEISTYGDQIVQQMKKNDSSIPDGLRVLSVKSNVACTFSYGKEVLFVTTGLISQLTNEAQLAYFIARELVHIKQAHCSVYSIGLLLNSSLDEKIRGISQFDLVIEKKTDAEALQACIKLGYPPATALVCLDILQYSALPFEDFYVPSNYFSSKQMYVPSSFFDVIDKKGILAPSNPFNINKIDNGFKERKKELEKSSVGANTAPSQTELFSSKADFFRIRDVARLETIHLQISECDFSRALYSIFLMEQKLTSSIYLKRMKAYAWLGLVEQSFGTVVKKTTKNIETFQNEAQRFFRVLLRLNATGKAAFALRISTDFKNEFPEVKDFSLIQERIILLIRNNPLFDVKKFSSKPFEERTIEVIQTPSDSTSNKYERIEKARNQSGNLFLDSNQFYFYGISDLINDQSFMNHFDSLKRPKFDSKIQQKVVVAETAPLYFKHQKIVPKSQIRLQQINSDLLQLAPLTQLELSVKDNLSTDQLTTAQYNEMALFASVYNQLFHSNQYTDIVLPVDGFQLRQLQSVYGANTVAFPIIRSTFRAQLKGAQILGLMIVPLPLVVPPIWLGGFKSQFTMMYIHIEDGTLTEIDHQLSKDPMTRYLLKNRFYHSLSNYHNSNTF